MQPAATNQAKKMSSANFSEYVMGIYDLYKMTARNGFFVPKQSSPVVNEVMLFNILQGHYWCPKTEDLRIKNCVSAPNKDILWAKLQAICVARRLNVAWMDETRLPDKKWMIDVLATLDPSDEIFRKDYVAPPNRKRLRDIETIVLPNELFEGLPKSTSKLKARRLKITSEAFAAEKVARLKEIRKDIGDEIIEQE